MSFNASSSISGLFSNVAINASSCSNISFLRANEEAYTSPSFDSSNASSYARPVLSYVRHLMLYAFLITDLIYSIPRILLGDASKLWTFFSSKIPRETIVASLAAGYDIPVFKFSLIASLKPSGSLARTDEIFVKASILPDSLPKQMLSTPK